MGKTMAIQAGGYLLLLALIYEWLGISDRSIWQVLLSGVLAVAILFGALWLIGSALAAPRPFHLRRMPALLVWVVAAAAVVAGCVWLAGYRPRVGLNVASHLTLWFRRPVKPQTMGSVFVGLLWLAGSAGVLALLPFAVRRVSDPPGGSATRPTWQYWATTALVTAAGFALPGFLVGWVPKFQTFGAQTASLIVRFALAYAIAIAAWLTIAWSARRFRSAATA